MVRTLFQTKSARYMRMFTKPEREQLLDKYISSTGFGDKANFGEEAFSAFTKTKLKDLDGFKETKADGDAPAFKKILTKTTPDVTAVKTAIQGALSDTNFDPEKAQYEKSLAQFKEFTQLRPIKYTPIALIGHLKDIQDTAKTGITAKQRAERDKFVKLLADRDFTAKLTAVMPRENIEALKENMLEDLDKAHVQQLKDFDKACGAARTDLLASNNVERERWLFAAMLFDNNMMRDKILDLAKQNQPSNTVVHVGITKTQISFAGIKPEDLGIIKTATGKKLHPNPDGGFFIKFGITDIFSDGKSDIKLLAFAIRASGYSAASFDVDIQPQDKALKRARDVYAAAIEAGFDPQKIPKEEKVGDKITIRVNGKAMRADELFKGHEGELQSLHQRAGAIRHESEILANKGIDGSSDMQALKTDLTQFKAQAEAKAAAAAAANLAAPNADPALRDADMGDELDNKHDEPDEPERAPGIGVR